MSKKQTMWSCCCRCYAQSSKSDHSDSSLDSLFHEPLHYRSAYPDSSSSSASSSAQQQRAQAPRPSRSHTPEKKLFFVRPIDGKRRGNLGRIKDALSGEGPDVFVVWASDNRTASAGHGRRGLPTREDMPNVARWSGWDGPLFDERGEEVKRRQSEKEYVDVDVDERVSEQVRRRNNRTGGGAMRWARRGSEKGDDVERKKFNFFSRRYEGPKVRERMWKKGQLWTAVKWEPGSKRGNVRPREFRVRPGEWYSNDLKRKWNWPGERCRRA